MNTLWLTEAQARQIVEHAHGTVPEEACGLIFGHGSRADAIVPVTNVADEPQHHYLMSPAEIAQHLPAYSRKNMTLIGLYHSHPNGEPVPSQTDIRDATFPHTAYLIVGLSNRRTQLAAWTINQMRVQRLQLHISDLPPQVDQDTLSRAQQVAIVLSTVLAVAIMLALSIHLLPPAPPIPVP